MNAKLCVYYGEALGQYGFGQNHPFNKQRLSSFWNEIIQQSWFSRICICEPKAADQNVIERFHTCEYIEKVKRMSQKGHGYLDLGDTPAFPGVYEAAAYVVGSVVDALTRIMESNCQKAFVPIAGLHHARRDRAAGFCVFNDCGVAIETLRRQYGVKRIAYVDIDAHHGDGVYYGFETDAQVWIVDIHEDGRFLYPGSGRADETGCGAAKGTKLNLPMPPGADDHAFLNAWKKAEDFLEKSRPDFFLLQCGADSLAGDPLTHLHYSPQVHAQVATRLCRLAAECGHGRILACGGGGYNFQNIATAWTGVVKALLQ